jgi:hypothetical protein
MLLWFGCVVVVVIWFDFMVIVVMVLAGELAFCFLIACFMSS